MTHATNNLFSSISCKAEKLLDWVYYPVIEAGPFGCAHNLVAEFEAQAVPDIVKLIFACFHVYYMAPWLFSGLSNHLQRDLILLRNCLDSMEVQ